MTTSDPIRRTARHDVAGKKILFIVSNPATLMGFPVGFIAEEMTGPFYDLTHAGCSIDIASPQGGKQAPQDIRHFVRGHQADFGRGCQRL